MERNEAELIRKSKEGNIKAFEQLISAYEKKVFNIALRMIGTREDASDLAQEVFLRVYRTLRNFKEESAFSTWIFRIATNICLDEIRKLKGKKTLSIEEDIYGSESEFKRQYVSSDLSPENCYEQIELRRAVNSAVSELPENQRIVIILRDIQGYSYEEIADMIDCPVGTVKSRINRARRDLKEIFIKKRELIDANYVK